MALREFFPLIDPHFQPAIALLTPATNAAKIGSPSNAASQADRESRLAEPALNLALSSIDGLALDMEQARQGLLALLLENSFSSQMLAEQLAHVGDEGAEDSVLAVEQNGSTNIVQDYQFVQPDSQSTADHLAQLHQFHFLPTVLIRIAERVQPFTASDPAYHNQLEQACRQLQTSRQTMIAANTGLVGFVAYKHITSLSIDDLMQEGIVGLIKAVDRFDPHRGYRFSTYAIYWIRQAISRLIVKQEKVVRLPVALAERASTVFEAMRTSYLENNRWPSLPELQAQCELSLDDIKTISSYYQATHSLDAALSEDSDDHSLMASLKQQQFALPMDELIASNLNLYLGKAVDSLPDKEAAILSMRFGLKNQTEMTLQAIADQLNLTRERVRQIQNAALQKLKQQFGHDLMPFLEPNNS
jgi:RNA polymerase primary sigma factor